MRSFDTIANLEDKIVRLEFTLHNINEVLKASTMCSFLKDEQLAHLTAAIIRDLRERLEAAHNDT